MSKVSGTYATLSRGVSQQPFEARIDGQHGEQVNMWSDPVHGLTKRRGTILQSAEPDNIYGPSYFQVSETEQKEARDYFASYRTVPYTTDGLELLVHFPTQPIPNWMGGRYTGPSGGIKITRKIQKAPAFGQGAVSEPLFLGLPTDIAEAQTQEAIAKGFSAGCQMGRYFLLYPNNTVFEHQPEQDAWNPLDPNSTIVQRSMVGEIKIGVPNRTYTLTHSTDGVTFKHSYTTPSSSYSGVLDTSDIPFGDPEYQKKVNDRVNAYNSAVTAWITTAAQQSRPAYIAMQLATQMHAVIGAVGNGAESNGPSIYVTRLNNRTQDLGMTDGGDNTSVAVSDNTVTATDQLTRHHYFGKIMRVQPDRGGTAFYVKAIQDGATTYNESAGKVRWEECPRTSQPAPKNPFVVIAVKNPPTPGNARVAASINIDYLKLFLLNDPTIDLPAFGTRLVGDGGSSPAPAFVNRQINWMGMFQDRLCMASSNVISMSEIGNYFQFYRTATLTVPDRDPVEVYALGSEADTIRHSVIFDRSLLLFGDNQQYSIDGRNPVTPSTSSVIQSSAIEDATDCPPVAGGSLVFFGKRRESSAEIFQMEVGDVSDTSNFSGLGLQLSDYLPGRPSQLLYVSSPSTLFVRCSEAPHSVFVFRFIDQQRQRVLDSWSRFDYHPAFGLIYSMFYHDDAVYYLAAREAWRDEEGTLWNGQYIGCSVLERQSMLPHLSTLPYLDSLRLASNMWGSGADFVGRAYPFMSTALAKTRVANLTPGAVYPQNPHWLHGMTPNATSLAGFQAGLEDVPGADINYGLTGIEYPAYVQLTSPTRKDQAGLPIMSGRLTITALNVSYKDSSGLFGDVQAINRNEPTLRFNGRVLGGINNVGLIPVSSGTQRVPVGREVKEYVCTLSARAWMPLSITRVTWVGQWFLNHRNV